MPPHATSHNSYETPVMENPHKGGAGPTVGIVIILAFMLLGGIYFATKLTTSNADAQLPLILGDSGAQQ